MIVEANEIFSKLDLRKFLNNGLLARYLFGRIYAKNVPVGIKHKMHPAMKSILMVALGCARGDSIDLIFPKF